MNLPNYLTLARIFLVPLLVAVLLTSFSEDWFNIQRYALAIGIFLIASFTDILDGHLARRRNQVSNLGKLLDPIADKLLVSAALIVLSRKTSRAVVGGGRNSRQRVYRHRLEIGRRRRRHHHSGAKQRKNKNVGAMHRHRRAARCRR